MQYRIHGAFANDVLRGIVGQRRGLFAYALMCIHSSNERRKQDLLDKVRVRFTERR